MILAQADQILGRKMICLGCGYPGQIVSLPKIEKSRVRCG